ncbi:MAG: hypothetical protein GSR77_05745 [Desulfurococcales archaeon]|nr:hypothetical protein [Desulfurococcales archaeon]
MELLNALARLDKLLDKHRIGYIVIGSLADYLLGISTIEPNDIDILVSKENVEKLNTMIQQEQDIDMFELVKWREGSTIRGFYGRALLERVLVDIMADVQFKYLGKWMLFTYEKLLPCTIENKINDIVTVRIPCPEIQVIADKALGRQDRAEAVEDMVEIWRCNEEPVNCLLTV